MVMAAIGRMVLADLIKNHMKYLKALTSQLQALLAAPAEIKQVSREVDALYVCIELLLEQVVAQDSIINTQASEEATTIEKFLENCTKNLSVVTDMIQKHVTRLPDGRKTWSNTFQQMYKAYSWTLKKGTVEDLIQTIKSDLEMVTKITSAIQSKSLSTLQNTLSQVAEDTHYIRQTVDELKEGMQRINELLIGMAQGSRDSLYGMFGSSSSFDDADDHDDNPPAYAPNSEGNGEFIPQDRFRRAASMRWQLVPQDEPSTLRVTTAEFLWRMAKVAADVHPWDNKIRSSNRYSDGTCDKSLYNIICHLMDIAETRARWSTVSIASWLTAGAWYLSLARFQLSFSRQNRTLGSPMEIYAAFVKVYWIVLTIDQHPQKPSLQDAGQTYQELEQYENLIAALHNEINNAEKILERESLQKITLALHQSLGKIWEREVSLGPFSDHAVGSYANRILESAVPSQSYIKPTTRFFPGQWDNLCPRTCVTLPKLHEHVPRQPVLFACMCDTSQHLQLLNQYYITASSYAENMNPITLKIHNVGSVKSGSKLVAVAVECPSLEATKTLKAQLELTTARLLNFHGDGVAWAISSFRGPKTLRLTRSAFDNGKAGAPFMKALVGPRPDHWREIEVPEKKLRHVDETIEVEKPPSIWSGFWSFLGYGPETEIVNRKKEVWETVIEKKKVPDTQLNEYFTPKQKPPDHTEALAISPMSLAINSHWIGSLVQTTIHIISTSSCFEIWFDLGSEVKIQRPHNSPTALLVVFPPNVKGDVVQTSKSLEAVLEFNDPESLEHFQRTMLVAKAYTGLKYLDHWPSGGVSGENMILWQGRIQACADDIVKSSHRTGKRYLILVGKIQSGTKQVTAGITWESTNMEDSFVFQVRHGEETAIPSPTSDTSFWLKIINGKTGTSTSGGTLNINFVTPHDAIEARGVCEGKEIKTQKLLKALKFAPIKKMGVHVSSKSQGACTIEQLALDKIEKAENGSTSGLQLWFCQNGQWAKLVYYVSDSPRCSLASSILYIQKAEMFPCSVWGPASTGQGPLHRIWKGNFEMHFHNAEDANQIYGALTGRDTGVQYRKSAQEITETTHVYS